MELTLFIKPAVSDFCAFVAFMKDGKMYIHDAVLADNIADGLRSCTKLQYEGHEIILAKYDGTTYTSDGRYYRSLVCYPLMIFKAKGKQEDKILSQLDWLAGQLVWRTTPPSNDYKRFRELCEGYQLYKDQSKKLIDKDNAAFNLLVYAASHFRRLI